MKHILLLSTVIFVLIGCQSEPSENQIQTAIAETEAFLPTPTPAPTPTTSDIRVTLEIRSTARRLLEGPMTVEWGKNNSRSTISLGHMDIAEQNLPVGYYTIWNQNVYTSPGDIVYLSITSPYAADCVIVVKGEDVVISTLETDLYSEKATAVCEYQIP